MKKAMPQSPFATDSVKSRQDACTTMPVAHQGLSTGSTAPFAADMPAPGKMAMGRRGFLKGIGRTTATLVAAGGLVSCERKPKRQIVSYAKMPEHMKPGESLFYASTWTEGDFPYGMVIKTMDGRPSKIEGNPAHPVNRSTSSAAMQAAVMQCYDPNRLHKPMSGGAAIMWKDADAKIVATLKDAQSVAIITRTGIGPAERELVQRFLKAKPGAKHFAWQTVHDAPRRQAWRDLYGAPGVMVPHFDKARVILSIGSDFLATDGTVLQSGREYAVGRTPQSDQNTMSRLYVAEGALTLTGSNADHRLAIRPSRSGAFLQLLLAAIKGEQKNVEGAKDIPPNFLKALAGDLLANKGKALVVAGGHLPASVHAQVAALNEQLQSPGNTLEWNPDPPLLIANTAEEIAEYVGKETDLVLCLGVDPAESAALAKSIKNARLSVRHGLFPSASDVAYTMMLPSAHNLESWNDASPVPGTFSLCQPVLSPLDGTRQEAESLLTWVTALASPDTKPNWHDWLKSRWRQEVFPSTGAPSTFDAFWHEALRTGVISRKVTAQTARLNPYTLKSLEQEPFDAPGKYEVVIRPHPFIPDARFARVGWLREMPDPITKIVWDATVLVAEETAKELAAEMGDVVRFTAGWQLMELPLSIQPGMAPGVLAVSPYLFTSADEDLSSVSELWPLTKEAPPRIKTPFLLACQQVEKTGERQTIVSTQAESDMHDRPIILHGTEAELREDPHFVHRLQHVPEEVEIHDSFDYSTRNKWGMMIDLSRCTGCGNCTVACQAENNIASVGKEECGKGREMQWLRIDRYYEGSGNDLRVWHQPVPCMHCENAPCENVCPVAATTHSPDGLNEMTYNRCVGTRYCSNNCPYKVRHFNFFNYTKRFTGESKQVLAYNPQVTVRTIGVMEKCTFCVQRFTAARYRAKAEQRPIRDGEAMTACQQVCPSGAIVFGDLNDPNSEVSRLSKLPWKYHLLAELNTKPRVGYMARIQNPHPDLVTEKPHDGKEGHG